MRFRRISVVAAVAALSLGLTACGDDGNDSLGGASSSGAPSYQLKQATSLPASPTLDAIKKRGKVVVGTKFDQPLFGVKTPSGKVEGFDAEIGRLLATYVLGDAGKVEFVEAISKNREPFIQEGRVDAVVATYTINAKRKQLVDFAGPYYLAGQDIMVRADTTDITGVTDLNGRKVSTVQGSTSEKNVREKAPRAQVVLFDTYTAAAQALQDKRVAAESTDNVILLGLVDQFGKDVFKLVGKPFTSEPYGIGLKKGDTAFRTAVNDMLAEIEKNGDYKRAYDATVGKVGQSAPTPPPLDRY